MKVMTGTSLTLMKVCGASLFFSTAHDGFADLQTLILCSVL